MNHDEKRRAAAAEADRILDELSKPEIIAPEPPAEPQPDTEPIPVPDSNHDALSAIKAERDSLKAQLEAETNQQRVSTLTGMTRAQAEEIKALRQQVHALEAKLNEPPPKLDDAHNDDSYEQDVADFGEATAKRMKADRERIHKLEAMVNDLSGTLKPATEKLEQVERTSNQTAQDILNSALDAAAPGWRQLNTRDAGGNLVDRGWDAFLDQRISEYSGQTFNDVLRERYAQGDVAAVAKIHNEYLQRSTSSSSTVQPAALDKHIDPSPTGGSGGTKNQKPTYTRTEYDKFMSDKRRGQTGLTSEEARKKFDELNDALADGRVIGY